MLAQVSAEADWIKTIINVGALGIVGWVVLYVFKVLIPKLLDQFSADLKAQRSEFIADMKVQREEFRVELVLEREARREMAEGLKASVAKMADSCSRPAGHGDRRHGGG